MKMLHNTEHSVWSNICTTSFRTVEYRFLIMNAIVEGNDEVISCGFCRYNDIQNSWDIENTQNIVPLTNPLTPLRPCDLIPIRPLIYCRFWPHAIVVMIESPVVLKLCMLQCYNCSTVNKLRYSILHCLWFYKSYINIGTSIIYKSNLINTILN